MKKLGLLVLILVMTAQAGYSFDLLGLKINGFISQGYINSQKNQYFFPATDRGSLEFNEIGLNTYYNVLDDLTVGVQLMSRDFGDQGNNAIDISWAVVDYRWQDWMSFKAGKLKVLMGLYNETRDVDMVRNSVLMPASIYSEAYREVCTAITGAGVYGYAFDGLSYSVLAGGLKFNDVTKLIQDGYSLDSDYDNYTQNEIAYVAELKYQTPIDGLRVGVSYCHFNMTVDGTTKTVADAGDLIPWQALGLGGQPAYNKFAPYQHLIQSVEYRTGPFTFFYEYLQRYVFSKFVGPEIPGVFSVNYQHNAVSVGYYYGMDYRVTDQLVVGGYISKLWDDTRETKIENDLRNGFHNTAVYGNYLLQDNLRVKLEYSTVEGLDEYATHLGTERYGSYITSKVTYDF